MLSTTLCHPANVAIFMPVGMKAAPYLPRAQIHQNAVPRISRATAFSTTTVRLPFYDLLGPSTIRRQPEIVCRFPMMVSTWFKPQYACFFNVQFSSLHWPKIFNHWNTKRQGRLVLHHPGSDVFYLGILLVCDVRIVCDTCGTANISLGFLEARWGWHKMNLNPWQCPTRLLDLAGTDI